MDINSFIQNFAEQFDETDPGVIKSETVFKDLEEWSSIIALSVIAMVDEEYNVTINGEDVLNSNTIEDLFNVVKSRA